MQTAQTSRSQSTSRVATQVSKPASQLHVLLSTHCAISKNKKKITQHVAVRRLIKARPVPEHDSQEGSWGAEENRIQRQPHRRPRLFQRKGTVPLSVNSHLAMGMLPESGTVRDGRQKTPRRLHTPDWR